MSDYDKFIAPNLNRVEHGNGAEKPSLSTQDFNPSTIADREEKQAVQNLLTNDSSNPITLSAIGIGLLSIVIMLAVRLRRGLQPALGDNVMEMKAQDPNSDFSAASRVGWGQRSSQTSHPLTVRNAKGLSTSGSPKRLCVLGGSGYVGREVCKRAVEQGWEVASLSRRGENPKPGDAALDCVDWQQGDAADPKDVQSFVKDADAVVHAVGLLFDVDSGLANLSPVVSGSNSVPGEESTYDRITRQTAFNAIDASVRKLRLPFAPRTPFAFVSCAESGWPDVSGGSFVETNLAPEWLQRYLVAKRAVEAKLNENTDILRPIIYRPSLIWSWGKLDVLPIIPVFNLASALGVPFVDRTIRVGTLADAIVAGVSGDAEGVQRFAAMDELAAETREAATV